MAKRVNKKFLVILTASVMGAGIAAVAVSKLATRGDTAAQVAAGDRHAAAKDWEKAAKSYGDALRKSSDVGLIVKYGDVLHEMIPSDPNLMGKDVGQWERALQIEPNHVPALRRMMDAQIKAAEFHYMSPGMWDGVRERAAKLASVDATDARAKAWSHIAVINAWLASKPVPDSEIEQNLAALAALAAKDPADATVPFAIARAYLRRAEEALPRGADAVKVERDRALEAFAAVKTEAQKNNPALLYRYAMVLMATSDQNLDGQRDGARMKEAKDLLYKAQLIVEKGHENYAELKLAWIQELRQQRKFEEAEREARRFLEDFPGDMRARMTLATVLRFQEGKRLAAIEVLQQPSGEDPTLKGYAGLRIKQDTDARRLVDLLQLRLDQYGDPDPKIEKADREAQRPLMEEELRRLAELTQAESGIVLKFKGLTRLLGNDRESIVEGIRLLEEAHNKLNRANNRWQDVDLGLRLAQAYLIARDPRDRQPEQAKQLYASIVAAHPRLWLARRRLAELHLRDHEYDKAKPHVDAMEAEPELAADPDVVRFRIVLMAGLGKFDDVKRMALALPEQTSYDQWMKVNALQAARMNAEAEALARKLSDAELAAADTKDYRGTQILAQILKRGGKGEEALALVERALKKSPNHRQLEIQKLVLEGKTNEANEQLVIDAVRDNPVMIAVRKAHLLADQGKTDEAMQALLEQDKRTPNTAAIMEEVFQLGLNEKRLEVAEEYARKLKAINADQSEGLSYEARLKLARRDLEGALRDATELARRDTRAATFVIMGQVQQAMGQPDAAAASYEKALARQSDNYEALRGIVECYLALNQINTAENFVRQGLKSERLRVFFEEVQRRIAEHHRDPRYVTKDREDAIKNNPDVPRGYVALAENQVKVAAYLAKSATSADLAGSEAAITRATETLKTAVERWPDDIVLTGRLSEMYLRRDEQFPKALAALEALAARERWKDRPEPWQLIANLQLRKNETAKANEAMEIALKRSNNSFTVRQQMVTFYLQTGQVEKGIGLLTQLVAERGADDKGLRTQLIEVLVAARRFDDAETLVSEVLNKDPSDARMLSLRAFLRMSQGKVKEADEAIAAALKSDRDYAPALYYRGMLKLRANDLAGAADDLGRARELNPTNVDMRQAMSEVLRRRGNIEESTKELEAALQLAPMRRDLRSRLFDLYFGDQRWVAIEKLLDDAKNNPDLAGDPTWRKAEARMWLARDNPDKAMAAIQVAATLPGKDPDVDLMFLEILQRQKNYDEVLSVTGRVMAGAGPKPWWMYVHRATALDALKRPAEAESALESALTAVDQANDSYAAAQTAAALEKVIGAERTIQKLEPRAKLYWALEIAQMRLARQEWSKAVELADQILQEDFHRRLSGTQKLRALTLAGQIYTSSMTTVAGSLEKAEQAYVKFLSESEKQQTGLNSQLQALNNLAFLFSDHPTKPNPQRALGYSKRAFDLMNQANAYDVNVADTHGWVLVLNDRADEGIEVLKGALAKKALPDTHYHLGEAYLRKAQYDAARTNFDQATALLKQIKDRGGFVDPALQDKLTRAVERLNQSSKSANAGN